MVDDPGVGGDERDAEHERNGHANPLTQAGVGPVEEGAIVGSGAVGSDGVHAGKGRRWLRRGCQGRASECRGVRAKKTPPRIVPRL